ncbi:MAG: glycosyltransferase family 4 protein, partial [Novosphingobium sp.]
MQFAVFHPGTQHSWQTAMALQQLGRLAFYATSIFHQPDRWPYRLERYLPQPLAERVGREFRRFAHAGLDPALVRTAGVMEWLERIATRLGQPGLAQRLDAIGNRRFGQALGAALRSDAEFGLWGYNGSSREAFAIAAETGRKRVLDRTIGDWRFYNQAMDAIADRYGAWFLPTERRVEQRQIDADDAEYALADRIVIGSAPAAETLRRYAGPDVAAKTRVLPYCFDEALFGAQPAPRPVARDAPVEFLFVGVANPRKGIHHALEAIAAFPPTAARLTIVGRLGVPREAFAPYADRVRHLPTVPRGEVPAIMASHHVLLFPSYFEGSALSLIEALASGMALIQTRQAGNGVTPGTGILLEQPD